jgi:hypothetical protein
MFVFGSTVLTGPESSGSHSNDRANDSTDDHCWQPHFDHSEHSGWWIDPETPDQPNEGAEHP